MEHKFKAGDRVVYSLKNGYKGIPKSLIGKETIGSIIRLNEHCNLDSKYWCKNYKIVGMCGDGIWIELSVNEIPFVPNGGYILVSPPPKELSTFKFC